MVDLASLGRFGFLTLPNFSMIAVTNALEACRMANYVSGADAYDWQIMTLDGRPAVASNGLALHPTTALAAVGEIDILLVCGGIDVRQSTGRPLKTALRQRARGGMALGALCTGSFALAEAGLLDGYRCAIHWENLAAITEEFPNVSFVEDLFVIDRDRITCTGGVAPLDLMLALIEARLGPSIAAKVSEEFIVTHKRDASVRQRAVAVPDGRRPVVLERAAQLMQRHIEAPIAIDQVADEVGVSTRQLERLFKAHLGTEPQRFYAGLRLDRARELLRQSDLNVTEIGVACGFQSPSHSSTAYGRRFGHPPRVERHLGISR